MKHLMQCNGWIIEPSEVDGSIRVYPTNNDTAKICTVQSKKQYSVASVLIPEKNSSGLEFRCGVTIFHEKELELKTVKGKILKTEN